ncbi:MAG TPA: winged helix DNA-binding domain-containing protein [Kofleriaceae bacterium]
MNVALLRLAAQRIVGGKSTSPVDVVRHLLALQGQDLAGGKWAIGVRAPNVTRADVDAALAAREIVRSWPMRGTLHLLAAEDLKWLLALGAPGVITGSQRRRTQLGLDAKTLAKAQDVAERALAGGKRLSRDALIELWNRAGLDAEPHRAYHVIWYLAQHAVLCQGPDEQFVLVDEWIREHRFFDRHGSRFAGHDRDEALGELARRYFTSHGPATLVDLSRWVKLPQRDIKIGLAIASKSLAHDDGYYFAPGLAAPRSAATSCVLLPGFDELILGYSDRTATLGAAHEQLIVPGGNGVFKATIVAGGRVVGTWKKKPGKRLVVEPSPFGKKLPAGLDKAIAAYRRFLGADS